MHLGLYTSLTIMVALGILSFWWFRISRLFRGGIMGRSFGLAALAVGVHVVGESFQAGGILGWYDSELSLLGHDIFEMAFATILALAMFGFYKAWATGLSKVRIQESKTIPNQHGVLSNP